MRKRRLKFRPLHIKKAKSALIVRPLGGKKAKLSLFVRPLGDLWVVLRPGKRQNHGDEIVIPRLLGSSDGSPSNFILQTSSFKLHSSRFILLAPPSAATSSFDI